MLNVIGTLDSNMCVVIFSFNIEESLWNIRNMSVNLFQDL